jgi:hypothetical protein
MHIEGNLTSHWFLEVETQPEVGPEAYDAGAEQLRQFFHDQLRKYLEDDLAPGGRKVIEACLDNCTVDDYQKLSEELAVE